DLSIRHAVGDADVAQSGRLADLVVERDQREAEPEHQHDDDREPRDHPAVGAAGFIRRLCATKNAHCRSRLPTLRPIVTPRKPTIASPRMPIASAGALEYCARMMPQKNNAAIDSRIVAVRRFAARRGAVFVSARIGPAAWLVISRRAEFRTCGTAPAKAA